MAEILYNLFFLKTLYLVEQGRQLFIRKILLKVKQIFVYAIQSFMYICIHKSTKNLYYLNHIF